VSNLALFTPTRRPGAAGHKLVRDRHFVGNAGVFLLGIRQRPMITRSMTLRRTLVTVLTASLVLMSALCRCGFEPSRPETNLASPSAAASCHGRPASTTADENRHSSPAERNTDTCRHCDAWQLVASSDPGSPTGPVLDSVRLPIASAAQRSPWLTSASLVERTYASRGSPRPKHLLYRIFLI
jgi:hypothetical protein